VKGGVAIYVPSPSSSPPIFWSPPFLLRIASVFLVLPLRCWLLGRLTWAAVWTKEGEEEGTERRRMDALFTVLPLGHR
jgi:hypothetical protein